MQFTRKIAIPAFTAVAILGSGGIAYANANHPTPTPTVTTPTPTPTPSTPTVNPFANCDFTFTQAFTFDPRLNRFVTRVIPAIVCVNGRHDIRVYDLVTGQGR